MPPPTSADFASLTSALNNLASVTAAATPRGTPPRSRTTSVSSGLTTAIQKLDKTAAKLESTIAKLNKTQKDFGVSIGAAGKLQIDALKDSVDSFVNSFNSIDFKQLGSELGELASTGFSTAVEAVKQAATGDLSGAGKAVSAGAQKMLDDLTKERPGSPVKQPVLPGEILETAKLAQSEFGVLDRSVGNQIAQQAKDLGLSAEQLVQARRVFATTAMGDMDKVMGMQTRFFTEFEAKGMTPRIALEAITKYAELIARNGNRFADSFARAAADAKKIGIDLNKVSQIGDNIIDDFEGFLEGQAELGAMGFNFDSSRLAQIAETGSDADLFDELRSQLAATGKDITNLRRSERLALESRFGINISDALKLAGLTPGGGEEQDPAKEGNSLLGKLLVLLALGGPVMSMLSAGLSGIKTILDVGGPIVSKLVELIGLFSPGAILFGAITAIAAYAAWKMGKSVANDIEKTRNEGLALIQQGKVEEGAKKIRESYAKESNAYRAAGSGPYDDLAGGTSKDQLAGMQAADKLIEESVKPLMAKKRAEQEAAQRATLGEPKGTFRTPPPELTKPNPNPFGSPIKVKPSVTPITTSGMALDKFFPSTPTPPTIKKAQGGLVTGPGTGTSDSIPARLSNGEYVVKADATRKVGKNLLDSINTRPKTLLDSLIALSGGGSPKMYTRPQERMLPVPIGPHKLDKKLGVYNSQSDKIALANPNNRIPGVGRDFGRELVAMHEFGHRYKMSMDKKGFSTAATRFFNDLDLNKMKKTRGLQLDPYYSKNKEEAFAQAFAKAYSLLRSVTDVGGKDEKFLKQDNASGYPTGFDPLLTYVDNKLFNRRLSKKNKTSAFEYADIGMPGTSVIIKELLAHELFKNHPLAKKYHSGGIVGGDNTELPAMLQRGEAVLSKLQIGSFSKMIEGFNKIAGFGEKLSSSMDKLTAPTGGLGKLSGIGTMVNNKVSGYIQKFAGEGSAIGRVKELMSGGMGGLKEKALKFGTSKIPGLGGMLSGGLGGLKEKALKFGTSKIPGLSGAMNAFSAYKTGGFKGLAGSLAKGGIGKALGGVIGTAIPIPGVGTALGALGGDLIGKGIGKIAQNKTVKNIAKYSPLGLATSGISKLAKSKIGKYTGAGLVAGGVGKLGKMFAKKPATQMGVQSMGMTPQAEGFDMANMFRSMTGQQSSQPTQPAPINVDTSGIEQKLNNFINALQGIQINMDGAQVGKVLVNASDAAMTAGVFRVQSR